MNYKKTIENVIIFLLALGLLFAVLNFVQNKSDEKPISFKKGECVEILGKEGGYYKIIKQMKNTYITRAYGTYVRMRRDLPVTVNKKEKLTITDCIDEAYTDEWAKAYKQIVKEIYTEGFNRPKRKRQFKPRKRDQI